MAPVPSSDGEYWGVPPFIPPESMFTLELMSILRSQCTEFGNVPLSRRPQRWSAGHHGDMADGVFIPARQPTQSAPLHGVPPQIPSAPPSLGYAPEGESQAWYRLGRTQGPGPSITGDQATPGPGTFPLPPPGTFVPAQGMPPISGVTTIVDGVLQWQYEEILCLLHESRDILHATTDQQREIMRYMAGLNEWLERDVHDCHAELRGVGNRIDSLRNRLMQCLGIRPAVPFRQVLSMSLIHSPRTCTCA